MTLTASEFLRRFCQHVPPRGFVRIRHFGYLANARRAALIALARQPLACEAPQSPQLPGSTPAIWRCPRCGANMNIGPNLTAQSPLGLPVLHLISLHTCHRHYPGRTDGTDSLVFSPSTSAFPIGKSGRLLRRLFRGLLSVYSRYSLHACRVAYATLYAGGFSGFVTSTTAPAATRRSDPVPGRELHPLLTSAFHGALSDQG